MEWACTEEKLLRCPCYRVVNRGPSGRERSTKVHNRVFEWSDVGLIDGDAVILPQDPAHTPAIHGCHPHAHSGADNVESFSKRRLAYAVPFMTLMCDL